MGVSLYSSPKIKHLSYHGPHFSIPGWYSRQLMKKWVLLFWKCAKNWALLYYINLIFILNKTNVVQNTNFLFSLIFTLSLLYNFSVRSTWRCKNRGFTVFLTKNEAFVISRATFFYSRFIDAHFLSYQPPWHRLFHLAIIFKYVVTKNNVHFR
jgi:hypothetical protein